jgi:hypothetical protein
MAEYIYTVKDRQTGEVLCKGSAIECSEIIGCDHDYVRRLALAEPKRSTNAKYYMYLVEREMFGEPKRGGARRKDVTCLGCGLLMKNAHSRTLRCPECAKKHNRISNAQRMCEIRGTAPRPSPIRNPNAKYCVGCVYYQGEITKCCNYIFIKGKSRPCPPGKDCTEKIERKGYREKKERSTDISGASRKTGCSDQKQTD